jgi:hypothetical protein
MNHRLFVFVGFAVAATLAAPLSAQRHPATICEDIPGAEWREHCVVVAQAVESAQPQLGILLAGGNPTLGTASTGGLRLGVLPRVTGSVRLNLVGVRLPDLLVDDGAAARINRALGLPAPALGANVGVGVWPGIGVAPGIGGIGSVDLMGSATYLPFRMLGVRGFDEESPDIAWGFGARVGLLRESFIAPGVSVSVMRRSLGRVAFGDVCRGSAIQDPTSGPGFYQCVETNERGDAGEFAFDLTNWSTRLAAGKRLLGLGLTVGLGHDRFRSDLEVGVRAPDDALGRFYRADDLRLAQSRTSAFVNLSYTLLVGTLALEGGVMQGGDAVEGFRRDLSDFDPRKGTAFGSIGARIAF